MFAYAALFLIAAVLNTIFGVRDSVVLLGVSAVSSNLYQIYKKSTANAIICHVDRQISYYLNISSMEI